MPWRPRGRVRRRARRDRAAQRGDWRLAPVDRPERPRPRKASDPEQPRQQAKKARAGWLLAIQNGRVLQPAAAVKEGKRKKEKQTKKRYSTMLFPRGPPP